MMSLGCVSSDPTSMMNLVPLCVLSVASSQFLVCGLYCAVAVWRFRRDDRKDDCKDDAHWYSGGQSSVKFVEQDESNRRWK